MTDIASFQNDRNATVVRALGGLVAFPNGYDVFDAGREQTGQFVSFMNGPGSQIRDEAIHEYALEHFGDRLFGSGRKMHNAALDHHRQFRERDARMREPLASVDRSHDAERRERFRDMEPGGELMAAIQNADLADLTALTADGNLAALPDQAFAEAQSRYLVLNTVERFGLQAQFAAKASLADPLPTGPDTGAAQQQAADVLQSHRAEAEMVKIHARGLQDYAAFLGHVFAIEPADAFDRMKAT